MVFWSIVIAAIVITLALAWNKDRKRRTIRSSPDGFGNYAEQRFLEEDHPVTVHFGPGGGTGPASTRQGEGSSISYYGTHSSGGSSGGFGITP